MGLACGRVPRGTVMWASGEWAKLTVMEFILGLMEIAMRVISNNVSNMGRELKSLQMAIYTKGSTKEESLMAMASIIGQTDAISKELSRTD
jgi:hypothetical protein